MDRNFCRYVAFLILEADILETILWNNSKFSNKAKRGRRDGDLHALFMLIREGGVVIRIRWVCPNSCREKSRLHQEWPRFWVGKSPNRGGAWPTAKVPILCGLLPSVGKHRTVS